MKTIKERVSQILHEALRGYDQSARYRTEDGFVRWGLVEKDIIAAIDEATNPPTIDWQPIETAPKDGTMVLVYFETGGVPVVHRAWYDSPQGWATLAENGLVLYSREECVGWWSYTCCSLTQVRLLDGWQTPSHWAPYNGPKEGDR